MTKEERIDAINGMGGEPVETVGSSEPKAAEPSPATETRETAPGQGEKDNKAVSPNDDKPKATETDGGAEKGGKKTPNLYSQERANHAFQKQSKRLASAEREIAELKARLKEYEGKTRDSFVDSETGKLDEEAYQDFRTKKAIAEDRMERATNEKENIESEMDDDRFYSRCDSELGEQSETFKQSCNEVVSEDGATRLQVFSTWLSKHDPQQIAIGRIAGSPKGIRVLKTLMENRDARLEMLQQRTPHMLDKFLDKVEEGIGEQAAKKQSFADAWKARKSTAKEEPRKAMKPTGSAFQGTTQSGKAVHDKKYRIGLLY